MARSACQGPKVRRLSPTPALEHRRLARLSLVRVVGCYPHLMTRSACLDQLATVIAAVRLDHPTRVAIDGQRSSRGRVRHFSRALRLDSRRVLAWAFAQAVLAAIWELEDDGRLSAGVGWIALAKSIQSQGGGQLS